MLDSKDVAAEDLARLRRLVASDTRLHKALHDRFGKVASFLAEAILIREGANWDPLRARAAVTVTLSLLDIALDAFVADPSTSLVDHYLHAFDGAAALFD